jgi:HK97 family phage major capsid protein
MVISIPRITTGPAVAIMASENSSVNEVDLVETTLTVNVRTIAGQQDISQQLLDRSDPSIDSIVFGDLRSSYDQTLDIQMLAGTGSGALPGIRGVSGVNTVSYTSGTPTAAALLPKLYDAVQKIHNTRYAPPDTIVMHPRRSAWLASQLSSTFPLFQQGTLTQAAGTQDAALLTSFAGMRVVHDPSIGTTYGAGTNEDEIYVLRAADLILWEGPLQARVLPEVLSGTLTVRVQLFGYAAFASGRYPASITIISGTGLVAPTF